MVLGIYWLATLGTIKWNFKSIKMGFSYNGRYYVLRGLKFGKVQVMSQEKLAKALLAATPLCMIQLIPQPVGQCFALEPAAADPLPYEL